MSTEGLSTSSASEMKNLLDFSNSIIFKNMSEAEEYETLASSKSAYNLISALLELAPYDEDSDAAQSIIDSYQEQNQYYLNLLVKAGYTDGNGTNYYERSEILEFILKARTCEDHEIVWYQSNLLNQRTEKTFFKFFSENLIYHNKVLHNEGFAKYKKYWNYINFIIVIMTIERVITSKLDIVYDIDLFDEEDIRNMFASHGLDFFLILPDKYRKRLLKNLNYLLRYKGSTKALVQIMSIFGFEEIELFKYYLVKDFERDSSNSIVNLGTGILTPKLKFARIPYDEQNVEECFLDSETIYEDYSTFVEGDAFWQADEEEVKSAEFNYINTKYIGIDAALSLQQMATNFAFFTDFFYRFKTEPKESKSELVKLVMLNQTVSPNRMHIADIILGMHYLVMKILGYEDTIIKDFDPICYLNGFNPDDSILWNPDLTVDENIANLSFVRFSGSKVPEDNEFWREKLEESSNKNQEIPGKNVLWNGPDELGLYTSRYKSVLAFKNNLDMFHALRKAMEEEQDYEKYRFMQEIYNYKYVSCINRERYGDYETYSSFLKKSDPYIYEFITENDPEEAFFELCSMVETFIDNAGVNDVGITVLENSITFSFIRTFVKSIVNIFKAYTTQLKEFSIYYTYEDSFDNGLRILDSMRSEVSVDRVDSNRDGSIHYMKKDVSFDIEAQMEFKEAIYLRDSFELIVEE